jgi:hypothetical protein
MDRRALRDWSAGMIRVVTIFGALTALLWLADWVDTPDSIPAIKPLLWACAFCFVALLVRAAADLARRKPGGGGRTPRS